MQTFNILSQPIKQALERNYQFASRVIDIENVEVSPANNWIQIVFFLIWLFELFIS